MTLWRALLQPSRVRSRQTAATTLARTTIAPGEGSTKSVRRNRMHPCRYPLRRPSVEQFSPRTSAKQPQLDHNVRNQNVNEPIDQQEISTKPRLGGHLLGVDQHQTHNLVGVSCGKHLCDHTPRCPTDDDHRCSAPHRLDHCVEVIGHLGNVAMRRTIGTPTAGAVIGQHGRKRGKAFFQVPVGARRTFTSAARPTSLKDDRRTATPHADTHRSIADINQLPVRSFHALILVRGVPRR